MVGVSKGPIKIFGQIGAGDVGERSGTEAVGVAGVDKDDDRNGSDGRNAKGTRRTEGKGGDMECAAAIFTIDRTTGRGVAETTIA